jgi:hypothetical protein
MSAEHNHPPFCCCRTSRSTVGEFVILDGCDACPEHGALAVRPPTEVWPRPGDLEAATRPHSPIPSGKRVSVSGPERCDLCGLAWTSRLHAPYTEQETTK